MLFAFPSAWRPRFACLVAALAPALAAEAATFPLPPPDEDLIGAIRHVYVQGDETLLDIARRHNVGFQDIQSANPGVDMWVPGDGERITLPTRYVLPPGPRRGIVLNLPEMRLYYYPTPAPGEAPVVVTYPMSIGRGDWSTPLGSTTVTTKVRDPSWYPPASIRREAEEEGRELPKVVPPGPENPLGRHALRLGLPGYLIHGTNRPAGVGMRVTHGCIRLFPEDVEALYETLPVGTPVRIINQPHKVGRLAGMLFLESHAPLPEDERYLQDGLTMLTRVLVRASADEQLDVNWTAAERVFTASRGIPYTIHDNLASGADLIGGLDGWCASGAATAHCATP
ncbi:MAG: L,D-transpeptidase family protein [Pseudomonadota bacterium]